MTGKNLAPGGSPRSALQRCALLLGAVVIAYISVGGGQSLPGPPDPDPNLEITDISGRERLTWDQAAASISEARNLRYVAFVDGAATDLRDFSCSPAPDDAPGFVCSAPIPRMTAGVHVIELAAYADENDRLVITRSWPIRVRMASTTVRALGDGVGLKSFVTVDGIGLRPTVVTTGLDDPTDLVTLADGRVLIAERDGRVRVFRDGALVPSPALTLTDVSTAKAGGLLALAADRDFETTRAVYALYTTSSGLRLARFVEFNGTLTSRAILLEGLPISDSRPGAALRAGPDGKLYLGLDAGGDANNLGDLGSFSGKVLRLNSDGTTPEDQAGGTPIFAIGLGRPTGIAWSENRTTLWLAGTDRDGSSQLRGVALGPGVQRDAPGKRYALPPGVVASAFATYQGSAIPAFRGNMFIADEASRSILRVRFDPSGAITDTEWLFRDQLDSVRAMSVALDGSFYVATSDTLVRIIPEG